MNRFFMFVILFVLLGASVPGYSVSAERIHSIDVSGLPETKDFYAALNGEWSFFHKQMLNAES